MLNGFCNCHQHLFDGQQNQQDHSSIRLNRHSLYFNVSKEERELLIQETKTYGFISLKEYLKYKCLEAEVDNQRKLNILWQEFGVLKQDMYGCKQKLKNILGESGLKLKYKNQNYCRDCGRLMRSKVRGDYCPICRKRREQEFKLRTLRVEEKRSLWNDLKKVDNLLAQKIRKDFGIEKIK